MTAELRPRSPIDDAEICARSLASAEEATAALAAAEQAWSGWRSLPLDARIDHVEAFFVDVDHSMDLMTEENFLRPAPE